MDDDAETTRRDDYRPADEREHYHHQSYFFNENASQRLYMAPQETPPGTPTLRASRRNSPVRTLINSPREDQRLSFLERQQVTLRRRLTVMTSELESLIRSSSSISIFGGEQIRPESANNSISSDGTVGSDEMMTLGDRNDDDCESGGGQNHQRRTTMVLSFPPSGLSAAEVEEGNKERRRTTTTTRGESSTTNGPPVYGEGSGGWGVDPKKLEMALLLVVGQQETSALAGTVMKRTSSVPDEVSNEEENDDDKLGPILPSPRLSRSSTRPNGARTSSPNFRPVRTSLAAGGESGSSMQPSRPVSAQRNTSRINRLSPRSPRGTSLDKHGAALEANLGDDNDGSGRDDDDGGGNAPVSSSALSSAASSFAARTSSRAASRSRSSSSSSSEVSVDDGENTNKAAERPQRPLGLPNAQRMRPASTSRLTSASRSSSSSRGTTRRPASQPSEPTQYTRMSGVKSPVDSKGRRS